MELPGRKGPIEAEGEEPLSSVTRYYEGNDPGTWRAPIPHYRNVRVPSVYPGIDMVWRAAQGPDLEYDFSVSAGADPSRIQLRFHGARRIWIDRRGNLVMESHAGKLYHRRPVAWQEIAGRRVRVNARFWLKGGAAGFQLGRYDRHQRLWIDPVLSYSTYLGGAGYDAGYAIAVDSSGNSYVTNSIIREQARSYEGAEFHRSRASSLLRGRRTSILEYGTQARVTLFLGQFSQLFRRGVEAPQITTLAVKHCAESRHQLGVERHRGEGRVVGFAGEPAVVAGEPAP